MYLVRVICTLCTYAWILEYIIAQYQLPLLIFGEFNSSLIRHQVCKSDFKVMHCQHFIKFLDMMASCVYARDYMQITLKYLGFLGNLIYLIKLHQTPVIKLQSMGVCILNLLADNLVT